MKRRVITNLTLTCLLLVSSVSGQLKVRVEKDLLGEKKVPAEAYYGVQTARALEDFQISGTPGPGKASPTALCFSRLPACRARR